MFSMYSSVTHVLYVFICHPSFQCIHQSPMFSMYSSVTHVLNVFLSHPSYQCIPQSPMFSMYSSVTQVISVFLSHPCSQCIPQSPMFSMYSSVTHVLNVFLSHPCSLCIPQQFIIFCLAVVKEKNVLSVTVILDIWMILQLALWYRKQHLIVRNILTAWPSHILELCPCILNMLTYVCVLIK